MAAYWGWKFVNFLARQTTGWGPNDLAATAFVKSREFQQSVIDQVGITDAARYMEKAFPGTVKSPLAYGFRLALPLILGAFGKKVGGAKGGRLGLASGLALALITWGDITQSPEELHRIFSGEQDVPVRRGRYWIFGQTPFFGGKISYWRPHWYPMMRSRYKFRGSLWDSEAEYWAQGTPLSPILAPLIQGRLWDPYYWEKKHYYDRPYLMTGELFEPTMPFAWLLNMTIGRFVKPQRIMHQEYLGVPQPGEVGGRGMVYGAGERLGMGTFAPEPELPTIAPNNIEWGLTQGLYTTAEQMGLRGYMLNVLFEDLTGRQDFTPRGPIVQSARRATGYERGYWDMQIGDPFGFTEFFRRVLPHRRRSIEEYNPIRNLMPEWMPGEEYYIDFKHGDPFIKVDLGEARLPGPGYEALHRLHSGIPGTYDAIDRFLILADVAPYSDQYKQYKQLAMHMTKDEPEWRKVVKRKLQQRAQIHEEFNFLKLDPPEDINFVMQGLSAMYRRGIAAVTSFPNPAEATPITSMFSTNKWFPYKTPITAYKDYRLHGSQFTSWGHPIRDFIFPYMRKVRGKAEGLFGSEYISREEHERRDYEEYFDKLKYAKYRNLARVAMAQGQQGLSNQFDRISKRTMTGVNLYGAWPEIFSAMPKRERSFYEAFVDARYGEREEILDIVPPQMRKLYMAQWNIKDRKEGLPASYNVDSTTAKDMVDYFKEYHLPPPDWAGWHPDVDLRDVQLKVARQEAMNIHNFDLWESREREMARRPYIPTIKDIREPTIDMSVLQNALYDQLEREGFTNARIHITRTPSITNAIRMKFNIMRNRENEYRNQMRRMAYA
jgi:hypothetical protein